MQSFFKHPITNNRIPSYLMDNSPEQLTQQENQTRERNAQMQDLRPVKRQRFTQLNDLMEQADVPQTDTNTPPPLPQPHPQYMQQAGDFWDSLATDVSGDFQTYDYTSENNNSYENLVQGNPSELSQPNFAPATTDAQNTQDTYDTLGYTDQTTYHNMRHDIISAGAFTWFPPPPLPSHHYPPHHAPQPQAPALPQQSYQE